MNRTPEMSNRYLVTAFSIERGRWITDTTRHLELARMWAEDWLRSPDRYSDVELRDMTDGKEVAIKPKRSRSDTLVLWGDEVIELDPHRQIVWMRDLRAEQVSPALHESIRLFLRSRHLQGRVYQLIDDPALKVPPIRSARPVDPDAARAALARIRKELTGHKLGQSAPVPYPSSFRVARNVHFGDVVLDPDRGEAMVPGKRILDLGGSPQTAARKVIQGLPWPLSDLGWQVVDDVILTRKEVA